MTREEWLVIAAAAAAFAIINIIMWTVIVIKNKREKHRAAITPDISSALLKASEELKAEPAKALKSGTSEETTPKVKTTAEAPPLHRRKDFTVLTDIIMINTDEIID